MPLILQTHRRSVVAPGAQLAADERRGTGSQRRGGPARECRDQPGSMGRHCLPLIADHRIPRRYDAVGFNRAEQGLGNLSQTAAHRDDPGRCADRGPHRRGLHTALLHRRP